MGQAMRRAVACLGVVVLAAASARGEVAGLEYPSFGVSLVGPRGWAGEFPNGKFVVARWERKDEGGAARGLIEIRALPGRGMTLVQFADAVGKEFGAEVVDRSMTVDGAAAWRLEAGQAGEGLRVRGAVVVEHEGVMYAILGAARPDEAWRPAMREVLDRWKWVAVEVPAKRLRYMEDANALLLHGLVQLPVPVGMGVAEADRSWNEPGDSVTLGLCNFKKGGDDFQMTAAVQERREGETIEAFRARLLDKLRSRTAEALAWQEVPERFARRVTAFVKVAGPADAEPVYEQYAAVEVDDKRVLVVTFRVMTASDEDRAFYERQAEYMFRNLEVARGAERPSGVRGPGAAE